MPHKLHSIINDLINKEDYSLTYVKLDDAIKILKSLCAKASLSKCDVSDTFIKYFFKSEKRGIYLDLNGKINIIFSLV
jgi:hypothetical protein